MTLLAAAGIGLAVGFLGGMFGKGGSAIATPLLGAVGVPAIIAVAAPLPATVVGAIATRWIAGAALVTVTNCVLVLLGLRFLLPRGKDEADPIDPPRRSGWLLAGVATAVGLVSGLLANSGGFLFAPLYIAVLRLAVKAAFASSLAVAAVLAVPGTVVHAALGHIDWALVAVFAVTSVPLSFLGARVALRTDPARLERVYGAVIGLLGVVFLIAR